MHWRSLPIMLAAGLVLTACVTSTRPTVRGSGRVVSEPRAVAGLTGVQLAGMGELRIEQTGAESLTIEAEDNILPVLTSDVSGGTLRLGIQDQTRIVPTEPIVYRLTVRDLDRIGVSGLGDVSAPQVETTTLTVAISGSGNATVGGRADTQDVRISGAGRYMAEDLESKTARVTISGTGDAVVRVSETLDARISGAGSIAYIGDPAVTQRISGIGTITKR